MTGNGGQVTSMYKCIYCNGKCTMCSQRFSAVTRHDLPSASALFRRRRPKIQ